MNGQQPSLALTWCEVFIKHVRNASGCVLMASSIISHKPFNNEHCCIV